jgi:hypothetical protein
VIRACGRNSRGEHETPAMDAAVRDMPDLELALLKRGVDDLRAECERCARCRRTPLIGERVYAYDSGATLCELCRPLESDEPIASRLVHGPEFGHTMRITDRRAA